MTIDVAVIAFTIWAPYDPQATPTDPPPVGASESALLNVAHTVEGVGSAMEVADHVQFAPESEPAGSTQTFPPGGAVGKGLFTVPTIRALTAAATRMANPATRLGLLMSPLRARDPIERLLGRLPAARVVGTDSARCLRGAVEVADRVPSVSHRDSRDKRRQRVTGTSVVLERARNPRAERRGGLRATPVVGR